MQHRHFRRPLFQALVGSHPRPTHGKVEYRHRQWLDRGDLLGHHQPVQKPPLGVRAQGIQRLGARVD
jgi:hypothetical protein